MINTCGVCGAYRVDKIVDTQGPVATCPECGHPEPFVMLPLLAIGGASGTGKSTVGRILTGRIRGAVLLEADLLWRKEFNRPEDSYRDFFETWLWMAKNISQSGRPVVILGAGFAMPGNLEPCTERRYLATISSLALVCDERELARRLESRPAGAARTTRRLSNGTRASTGGCRSTGASPIPRSTASTRRVSHPGRPQSGWSTGSPESWQGG